MAEDYVAVVNDVIAVCKDAEEGFRGAAGAVNDPSLKSLFQGYSEQRAGFARQLQKVVEGSGKEADHPSGAAGKLHSAWIKLKGALTGHSEHQILSETERGEDYSMSTYRDALSKDLPPHIVGVLEQQFVQVQQAHDKIRVLRDSTAREPANAR